MGICHNLDQYLNMTLVERAGAGFLLRAGRLSRSLTRRAVTRALHDGPMRERGARLRRIIAGYRAVERFRDIV